ncbi:hypothetical protein KR044_009651, partial [Drosophila immigrans]
ELTDILLDLIDFSNEQHRKRILQFVCGLLNSEDKENIKLALKLSQKVRTSISNTNDPQLLQMLLLCMKSWSKHIAKDEKSMLQQIWSTNVTTGAQSQAGQRVIQIFEEFLNDLTVVSIFTPPLHGQIEQKLESKMTEQSIAGNYLLNKLLDTCSKDPNERELVDFSELDFFSYITIMQCLQVEQTSAVPQDDKCGLIWMRPVYIKLLCEDNMLVLRWTLEYFMLHTTSSDLRRANLLLGFLKATNRMELHDLDTYCLPKELMTNFVPSIEMKRFLGVLVKVPWLEVALVRWLHSLDIKRVPQITKDCLYQIVGLVKKIQNQGLRLWASETIFNLFRSSILKLSVVEYVTFSETLYDDTEDLPFVVEYWLRQMIRECKDLSDQLVHLKRGGFEKIFHRNDSSPYYEIFQKLQHIPKSCHGWWRLSVLLMLHNKPEVLDLYQAEYGLNIELFQKCTNLKEWQQHLLDKLNCNVEDEKLYVLQKSVDLFVETNLTDWSKLEELHLNPIDLMKQGTAYTLLHLTNILSKYNQRLQDEEILDAFVQMWKTSTKGYFTIRSIEFALEKELASTSHCTLRRDAFIEYAYRQSEEDLYELFNKLIRINLNINRNGMIRENSKENRAQMRILRAMLHTDPKSKAFWSNKLWQLLLSSSSQPNKICFLYECLVAQQLPFDESHFEQLLERIECVPTLDSIHQDSIISVLYIYCIRNADLLKLEHFEKVFERLLNQQMSDLHSQTQTFMQLVLHKLATKCEEKSIAFPMAVAFKTLPDIVFEDKVAQTITKVRLMLPEIMRFSPSDIILHIINAPIDEYRRIVWVDWPKTLLLYNQLRKVFASQKVHT